MHGQIVVEGTEIAHSFLPGDTSGRGNSRLLLFVDFHLLKLIEQDLLGLRGSFGRGNCLVEELGFGRFISLLVLGSLGDSLSGVLVLF